MRAHIPVLGRRSLSCQCLRNESMIEKHKENRSRISISSTAPKYTIRIRGKVPADLRQRVSALHAMAILNTDNEFKRFDR